MKWIKSIFVLALVGFLIQPAVHAQKAATATATVVNGFVVSITVTDGGSGYSSTPGVAITGSTGVGALAIATVLNGSVNQVIVINPGSGYATVPEVAIAGPPMPTPVYTIDEIAVIPKLTIHGKVGSRYWITSGTGLKSQASWTIVTNLVLTADPFVFVDMSASTFGHYYQAIPEELGPGTAPGQFVWIRPGPFTMGSPDTEQDRQSVEGPQTIVTLTRGFWMSKYETTQAEYQSVMGSNPSKFTGDLNRPVEQVSWYDATNYCGKVTAREQAAGRLPYGFLYRLPTEAEWEYACRAGTITRFSYGDDPGYTSLGDYAWYGSNSGSQTHPVGQKLPNVWGLYDMHGNVHEWCQDWYGAYPGGSVADPQGPNTGSHRNARGGAWDGPGWDSRSARRGGPYPDTRDNRVGFRPVVAPVQ